MEAYMIEQLFGSKTRVKLLQLFYTSPNRSFYVREITRKIDEQINSVRRELGNLLAVGIIKSDTSNNKIYYEVNQNYQFYEPLLEIFGEVSASAKKAAGKKSKAKAAYQDASENDLQSLGNVELALYTGQFTRDESAGIDFLLVGDVSQSKLQKFIVELEAREKKDIRYTVFSLDDFYHREQIRDRFLDSIRNAKKQVLVDRQHLLS
jgi:predicted transcriptional regulator